jgi:hypothetical protein
MLHKMACAILRDDVALEYSGIDQLAALGSWITAEDKRVPLSWRAGVAEKAPIPPAGDHLRST